MACSTIQLQVCFHQPSPLLPWGFQAEAVPMANPFLYPLFLAQLVVLKHIFCMYQLNTITPYTKYVSAIFMVICNDESLPTHDVWLQGLKQLAFHTAMHCQQMKTAPTLMTARVDPLPSNFMRNMYFFF
jgi:hypothetical protein